MVLGKRNVTLSVLIIAVFLIVFVAACSTTPKEQPTASPAVEAPSQVSTYTPPKEAPAPKPVVKSIQPVKAVELGDVFFAFDKSDLTSESRAILADNAEVLRSNPNATIIVEGHCDERGTEEYNLGLGERRASSVKNYLTSLGISSSRIQTISYGEEKPFEWGHNENAWSRNRRAHFVVK